MGYSIGIHVQNKKLQRMMLDFMEKEYRPHWQVRGLKDEKDCFTGPPSDNLDYFDGKCIIGIDFNAAGWERGYAFTLVRWLALKVGKTRKTFKYPTKATFDEPVPYMVYDGVEAWPVLERPLSSVSKNLRECCVDRYGMKADKISTEDFIWDLEDDDSFSEAQREACKRHGIDPDKPWPKPEPEGVRWKIHETRQRLLWPEVKKILVPMRDEMKRLDKAWIRFQNT